MDEHNDDEGYQDGEPPTVSYYVNVTGSTFDPRKVEWSTGDLIVYDMEVPGETYTSRRGKKYVASEGSVTLWQPKLLLEMNVFTDADPVLHFLVRHHDELRDAGVEEVVVMLGLYRDHEGAQMNGEFHEKQIQNLCRAGAILGISFYGCPPPTESSPRSAHSPD